MKIEVELNKPNLKDPLQEALAKTKAQTEKFGRKVRAWKQLTPAAIETLSILNNKETMEAIAEAEAELAE